MVRRPIFLTDEFAKMIASLHGREPTDNDRLKLADGVTLEDVLPISTRIAREGQKRLDPDPVSILLAALGALGSVASLAAYVEHKRSEKQKRIKARRSAIRAISSLREALGDIERALDDLEKLIGRYDKEAENSQNVLDAPAEFGAAPPLFDFFEFSVYQMIGQRVTRAFDRCVSDTYEVMDCIEDGAIEVPNELFAELGELQHRLNDLRYARRSLAEILSATRYVSQRMFQIINDFERHIVFDTV